MIRPAIFFKDELTKAFGSILYTQEHFYYEGGIDNYEQEITEEADKFQFAILDHEQLVGYISFRVDWYCSCAYNFGLISFADRPSKVIASAILAVIKMIEGFNLHRIDFRCICGNPAERGYDGIIEKFHGKYNLRKFAFVDNTRDRQGYYHDTIVYEMIRKSKTSD